MSSIAEISQYALRLPVNERAALLDQLFDSIDSDLGKVEKNWAAESERRLDALDRGEQALLDGPATIAKHRATLKK